MSFPKSRTIIGVVLAGAIGSLVLAGRCSAAESAAGLKALLTSDDAVIKEAVTREMTVLKQHLYTKHKMSADQIASFEALVVYKRLTDPKLTAKEAADLATTVARGADKLLGLMTKPEELMNLAASLVIAGTSRPMNMLEYWGEDPKNQSQLRPIAEAIVKIYQAGIKAAMQRRADLERQMNQGAAADRLAEAWQKAEDLVSKGNYMLGCSYYPLALSIDAADKARVTACEEGIKLVAEFEDPQFGIQVGARLTLGKLHMTKGTREGMTESKKKFAAVLKDASAAWGQKFEAAYFTAVADLMNKDAASAKTSAANLAKWLTDNKGAAGDPNAVKGAEAAVEMLKYRVHSLEAKTASTPQAREAANNAAIAVLQSLQKSRPDLGAIINQQLIARLPDEPKMETLNALLLQALMARGYDEAVKEGDDKADEKALKQGVAAAQELIKRAADPGNKDKLGEKEADEATLVLGLSYAKQANDFAAAKTFMDHCEKFKDSKHREAAFTYARFHMGKLEATQKDSPVFKEHQLRFLELATSPPFSRPEFFFDYSNILLRRVADITAAGKYDAVQKGKLIADVQKAIGLLTKMKDPKRLIFARYRELLGYTQLVELEPKSPKMPEWVARVKVLAAEITQRIDAALPSATAAEKANLKVHKVKTVLMIVDMSKNDKSLLKDVIDLTGKSFEDLVEGMAEKEAYLTIALYHRVNALLSLGRTDEALSSLSKLLETYSPEKALDMIVSMIEALQKEYRRAVNLKEEARADEVAANMAKVGRYLVDAARKSANPEIKKNLPQYIIFEAHFHRLAGDREKDPARKKEHYTNAMAVYQALLKQTTDVKIERSLKLAVANLQFDTGDYRPAQAVFGELLPFIAKWLPAKEPGEPQELNPQYFEITYKLLKSMWELCKVKADGFDQKIAEDIKTKLKQVFIMWGKEPGGVEWGDQFNELRKEVLPGWEVPATTQPSTEAAPPATQPAQP